MRILRAVDYAVMPWKNGLGETREIAREPETNPFGWRLSMATVDGFADFSAFPGVTRSLAVVGGGPLEVILEDEARVLHRGGVAFVFSGEANVRARTLGETVIDLNLMTAEGWHGSIEPLTAGRVDSAPGIALVVDLDTLDTRIVEGTAEVCGVGYLVRIKRTPPLH